MTNQDFDVCGDGMELTVRSVEAFIKSKLRAGLERDLRALKMVKEADLEGRCYYRLSRYFQTDNSWRVFARKHCIDTGHYVDLLIFKDTKPRFAIELKWDNSSMPEKDRASLRKAVTNLRVHKSYFISTVIKSSQPVQIEKNTDERHRVFELYVPLALTPAERAEWKEKRRQYTRNMKPRKPPQKALAQTA